VHEEVSHPAPAHRDDERCPVQYVAFDDFRPGTDSFAKGMWITGQTTKRHVPELENAPQPTPDIPCGASQQDLGV
jgi:hypothetical protein